MEFNFDTAKPDTPEEHRIPPSTLPTNVRDWKISPEEQAERDRIAQEVRDLEAENPAYSPGIFVHDTPLNKDETRSKPLNALTQPQTPEEVALFDFDKATPDQKSTIDFSFDNAKPDPKKPTYLGSLVTGVDMFGAGMNRVGAAAAANLISPISQELGDEVADYFMKNVANLEKSLPTPEQQAQMNVGHRGMQFIGGVIPGFALSMALRHPAPLMAALGGMGFATQAKQVEEGLSVGTASLAAGVDAAFNAAGVALPVIGATPLRAAVLGAVINPAQSVISEGFNKWLKNATGNEEFAKQHDPFDFEQRAFEAVFGGVTGGVFKKQELASQKRTARDQEDIVRTMVFPKLEQDIIDLNQNRKDFDFSEYDNNTVNPNNIEHVQWKRLVLDLQKGKMKTPQGEVQLTDQDRILAVLQYVEKHTSDPHYKKLAQYYQSLHEFFMSDDGGEKFKAARAWNENTIDPYGNVQTVKKSEIARILTPTNVPPGTRQIVGSYLDFARLFTISPEAKSNTVIHEIGHMLTSRVIDEFENHIANKTRPTTPEGEKMFNHLQRMKMILDAAQSHVVKDWIVKEGTTNSPRRSLLEQYEKSGMMTFDELQTRLAEMDAATYGPYYGLKDLKEFSTAIFEKKSFRDILRKITFGDDFKREFDLAFGGRGPSEFLTDTEQPKQRNVRTLLDIALNNWADIADKLAAGQRWGLDKDSQTGTAIKAMLDTKPDTDIEMLARQFQGGEKDSMSKSFSDAVMYRIGQIFDTKNSSEFEYRNKITSLFPHAEWKALIAKHFDTMFLNKDKIALIYSEYVHDPNVQRGPTQDLRHMASIIEDLFKDGAKSSDDISTGGTLIYGKDQLSRLKDKTKAGIFLGLFNDKVNEHIRFKAQLRFDFMLFHESFAKLPDDQRIRVMEESAYWDSAAGRQILRQMAQTTNRDVWWPSDAMLAQRGMTPEEIRAYMDMAAGYDYMYYSLDAAAKTFMPLRDDGTQFVLKRIPGFMPHFHSGLVKVMWKVQLANGKTGTMMKGFDTIFMAERFAKRIEAANNPNVQLLRDTKTNKTYTTIENRSPSNPGLVTTLIDHYNSYESYINVAPEIAQLVADLDKTDMRGHNKSLLKRKDVGGYLNEYMSQPAMKKHFGLIINKAAEDAFGIYERYATSVADFVGNAYFVKDVVSPILDARNTNTASGAQHHLAEMPHLTNYLDSQIANFTGENKNRLKPLDEAFERLAVNLKLNPQFFKFLNRGIRNVMSTVKLRSIKHWWANSMQPLSGLAILENFAVDNGLKPLDPRGSMSSMRALTWAMDQLTGGLDFEGKAALEWAIKNHIVDPQQDFQMGLVGTTRMMAKLDKALLGEVNMWVEGGGRKITFLMSYKYFKQFYASHQLALEAADRATRSIMVNYDRASRPLLYQEFGMLGEAGSAFAVFRNAYLGNTYLMLRTIARNPSKFHAWRPMLTAQMVYLLQAGLVGIIGATEYDILADLYNQVADPDYKLPLLSDFIVKNNIPDALAFGVFAEGTKYIPSMPGGVVLGSSATAPGLENLITPPILPFIQGMIAFGLIPAKEMIGFLTDKPGASSDDIFKAAKQIAPPSLLPTIQEWLGVPIDITTRANSLEGFVDNDPHDKWVRALTGADSIPTWRKQRAEEMLNRKMQTMKETVKKFADKVADKAMGAPLGMDVGDAYAKAVRYDPTLSYDDFVQQVLNEIATRRTSKRTRDLTQGGAAEIHKRGLQREKYGAE